MSDGDFGQRACTSGVAGWCNASSKWYSPAILVVIVLLMADSRTRRLKGGSIMRRDHWHGLASKTDFGDFKRWYHRQEKAKYHPADLGSAEEAEAAYADWYNLVVLRRGDGT